MEDRVARVYRFKKVLKYSILSLLITIVGLLVFEYFRIKPNNVYFTNITSSSITVSWDTKVKTDATAIYVDSNNKLPFLILPVFRDRFFDTRDITKAELKAAAQSSQNQDGLEVTMNDMVTNVSVTDRGKYYTHHVEIKGLEPETEYSFMVGDSIVFRKVKDVNNEVIAKTYAVPESILSPYPAYGAVKNAYGFDDVPINELPPVSDGIVYFAYYDEVTNEYSNMFSSPLTEKGTWYIDVSYAIDKEGNIFRKTYEGDEEGIFVNLSLNLGPLGEWDRQNISGIISPADTFVINIPKEVVSEDVLLNQNRFKASLLDKLYAKEVEGDCSIDSDCSAGYHCDNELCVKNIASPSDDCYTDSQCGSGYECNTNANPNVCEKVESDEDSDETDNEDSGETDNEDSGETDNEDSGETDNGDDLEASDGYSEVCIELGYCECGMVEDPGYKNLKKPCKGEDLKKCEDKFTARKCADYLPKQENDTCEGYHGSVAFEGVELHNGVCRICGYKGSGTTRYVGWINDDEGKYDKNNNCELKEDYKDGKQPNISIGMKCKDADKCICNNDTENITEFRSVCTIDNKNEVKLKIACEDEGRGTWDWQKNICECKDDTYIQSSDKKLCYKITEPQSPNLEEYFDKEGNYTGSVDQGYSPQDLDDKYCWENPGLFNTEYYFNNIIKCENNECFVCKDEKYKKVNLNENFPNRNLCLEFTKDKNNNSCYSAEIFTGHVYCVANNITYVCKNYTWQLLADVKTKHSGIIAISRVPVEPGERCGNDACYCVDGPDGPNQSNNPIENNQYCREVKNATECNTIGEVCDNNKNKKVCYNPCEVDGYDRDSSQRNEACVWSCVLESNLPNSYRSEKSENTLISSFKHNAFKNIYANETPKGETFIIDQSTGLISNIESGTYYFEVNNQTYFIGVSEEDRVSNDQGVLIYIDTNENGEYDEDTDTKISTLASQIEITTIQKNYKFNLKEGFNFVSFPFVVAYDEYKTAAALLAQLNDVYGDVIYSISRFDGAWKVVGQNVEVYDNNDFQLLPGQGYVIKAKENVDIVIPGKPIKYESAQDSAPVSLFPGWNLIGIYGNNVKTYTAKSMLQDINAYEPVDFTANNVSKWESDTQKYDGFQLEVESGVEMEYGFDYTIDILKSYFVKVESGEGNWQPKLAE